MGDEIDILKAAEFLENKGISFEICKNEMTKIPKLIPIYSQIYSIRTARSGEPRLFSASNRHYILW